MNFGSYFCGVLAALVYDQLALKQYKLRELKSFQLLWFTLIPVGILWLFSAHPIFQHYYVTPSAIWGALYAGLQRNIWGFGLGIFIVGMASKVGCKYQLRDMLGISLANLTVLSQGFSVSSAACPFSAFWDASLMEPLSSTFLWRESSWPQCGSPFILARA